MTVTMAKIVAVILLLCLAVLLYADLQSIHQIGPITAAMINSAPDAQTRQALLAERDRRNRNERIHKLEVGTVLALDLGLLVAASFFRRSGSALTKQTAGRQWFGG